MLFIWFYRSLNLYFSDYEEKERLVIMERERERESLQLDWKPFMLFIWFYRSLNLNFSDYGVKERLVNMGEGGREGEREREIHEALQLDWKTLNYKKIVPMPPHKGFYQYLFDEVKGIGLGCRHDLNNLLHHLEQATSPLATVWSCHFVPKLQTSSTNTIIINS